MALSKGGKSGSNVHDLDAVRQKRLKSCSATSSDAKDADKAANSQPSGATAERKSDNKPARRKSDHVGELLGTTTAADTSEDAAVGVNTPVKRSRVSIRRFDREKVDRIKNELARDEYRIDYLQLADKFIEHERFS